MIWVQTVKQALYSNIVLSVSAILARFIANIPELIYCRLLFYQKKTVFFVPLVNFLIAIFTFFAYLAAK